jgi:hypothetical protein
VLHGQPAEEEAGRVGERHGRQPRLCVEPCDHGRNRRRHGADREAQPDVDPEERAHLLGRHVLALHGGRREAEVFEEGDEAGHDRDHADEAVVGRRQQAREHGRRGEPRGELEPLRGDGQDAATSGARAEVGLEPVGAEVGRAAPLRGGEGLCGL